MSNLVFPSLPGIALKITREPFWKTNVQETLGGQEIRSTYWTYPRWRYTLGFAFLRSLGWAATGELEKLHGFVARHAGRLDSFLWTDPEDNAVTAHPFGVGTGSLTAFQLQRTMVASADLAAAASRSYWPDYRDGYEPVMEFNGTPTVYVNGTPTAATLGANGAITFGAAPANGAVLTWTGSFYKRVRFDEDAIPADRIVPYLYELGKLALISVKP